MMAVVVFCEALFEDLISVLNNAQAAFLVNNVRERYSRKPDPLVLRLSCPFLATFYRPIAVLGLLPHGPVTSCR